MSDERIIAAGSEVLLGIDIGGTKILGGLVDREGRIIERRQRTTRPGLVLTDTLDTCRDLLVIAERAGLKTAGVGVGAKGAVDHRRGCLVGSLYLGHGEILMGDHLSQAFGLPVRVENDVHAAPLGELVFGIGRSVDDFMFYNAGTGMAFGLVVGRRLFRGASNTAGENGHWPIDHSGRWPCPCGMSGCCETMIVAARKGRALASFAGPIEPAVNVVDPAYLYLASNLSDLVALLDPPAVVLAGGMLNGRNDATAWLINQVVREAHDRSGRSTLAIHHAVAGPDAGLVGAASLILAAGLGEPDRGSQAI